MVPNRRKPLRLNKNVRIKQKLEKPPPAELAGGASFNGVSEILKDDLSQKEAKNALSLRPITGNRGF